MNISGIINHSRTDLRTSKHLIDPMNVCWVAGRSAGRGWRPGDHTHAGVLFCQAGSSTGSDYAFGFGNFTGQYHVHFSFMSHHRRGAVDWVIVRRIVPGILIGTFLGTFVASRLSTNFLKKFFAVFLYSVAIL
jgi:hypothetical protein